MTCNLETATIVPEITPRCASETQQELFICVGQDQTDMVLEREKSGYQGDWKQEAFGRPPARGCVAELSALDRALPQTQATSPMQSGKYVAAAAGLRAVCTRKSSQHIRLRGERHRRFFLLRRRLLRGHPRGGQQQLSAPNLWTPKQGSTPDQAGYRSAGVST